MDGLPLLYEQSPGLDHINLEFSEIESLEPLLPLLIKFTELKELQLFGNRLESLPDDLSQLQNLETLDISNNLIEDVQKILPNLSTLPNLRHLSISLQTEDDEEFISMSLQNLLTLNGNPISRVLPPPAPNQSVPKIQGLTENKIPSPYLSESYAKSPGLGDNLGKSPGLGESIVKSSLSSDSSFYEYENNRKAMDFSPSPKESEQKTEKSFKQSTETKLESALDTEFVTKVQKLYEEIRVIWLKEDKTKDKRLEEDWSETLRMVTNELKDFQETSKNQFHLNLQTTKSKYDLANLCNKKILDLIFLKHKIIGGFLCRASEIQQSLFDELYSSALEAPSEAASLNIPEKISSRPISRKSSKSHTEVTPRAVHEKNELEAKFKQEKALMYTRFQEDKQELQDELNVLREENKRYLDTIIRHSKTYADSVPLQRPAEESKNYGNSYAGYKSAGKVLSLRQIKEVIDEIYVSKARYDERCAENRMSRETMEQHMNDYLNKKYGLKTLVIDWGASIVSSVKKYSGKDNDIAVFGRILRNECDEEFRLVQIQVKETVAELLKMNIKSKFPLKNSNDINELVQDKMNSYLIEEEWEDIIKYMYNEEDSNTLIDEVWKIVKKTQRLNSSPPPKVKVTREEAVLLREKERIMKNRILYTDFLKVLLDFQLHGHEKFLEKFLQLFKMVDSDNDGIINEEEFRDLVLNMDLGFTEEDVDRLLQVIDPYDNQQITFSEGVALFSTELIPVENVAVLKKLSMNS